MTTKTAKTTKMATKTAPKKVATKTTATTTSTIGRRVKVTLAGNKHLGKTGMIFEETTKRQRVQFESGGSSWYNRGEVTVLRGRHPKVN